MVWVTAAARQPPSPTHTMVFALVASFRAVDAAAAERIVDLLGKVRNFALSADEPGTLVYNPARKAADSLDFVVYEEYVDQAALGAHVTSTQFKTLEGEADKLFVGGKEGLKIEYVNRF
ncbi:uncharacterized protein LOC62_02G003445 [Vanrija pseudolonga]|uniref:ABM domain-containing protein n=1 Tax=Vanrija pseudolonga TaxID=143232 RepID=A0AAF1BGL4_9TREE|nr:hypothetical protein LOC62_02G003445 [Vanrija pseudolonga]